MTRGAHQKLTKGEAAAMWQEQKGLCGCGCGLPVDLDRCIREHVLPVKLGNQGKPDALYRPECAAEKTKADIAQIAKMKRQRGIMHDDNATGQQLRRRQGKTKKIKSNPKIRSGGFLGWRLFNGKAKWKDRT